MGKAVSVLRDELMKNEADKNKDVVEQLKFLVACANTKLDKYEGDLNEMFLNREAEEKKSVPGLRALRWVRGYHVGIETNASKGLGEVIDSFFGSGDKSKDEGSPVLNGFKKLVSTGLDTILSNANIGENEEQKFFVFMKHNAPIRIDVKIWRYNFASTGVIARAENVLCYTFCTSVVEHQSLSVDELTYLFSEYAGDEHVMTYIDELIAIWSKIHSIASLTGAKDYPIPQQMTPAAVPAHVFSASKPVALKPSASTAPVLPAVPVQSTAGSSAGGGGEMQAQNGVSQPPVRAQDGEQAAPVQPPEGSVSQPEAPGGTK